MQNIHNPAQKNFSGWKLLKETLNCSSRSVTELILFITCCDTDLYRSYTKRHIKILILIKLKVIDAENAFLKVLIL